MDDTALRELFDSVDDAIIVLDAEARVCFYNPATSTLLGMTTEEVTGRPITTLLPSLPALDTDPGRHQLMLVREGLPPRRLDVSVSPVAVAGQPWRTLLIVRPVEHESGDIVQDLALYDDVTPLPGRALFTDRVQQATRGLARRRSRAAVLLLDIDRFMEINAALGHARGDDVLRAVAERLAGALRASDTLARFSEDQFGVLMPSRATPAGAAGLVDRIQARLLRPFHFDGVVLYVTMTVGIALTRDGDGADELLRHADLALHQAKQLGPGSVAVFTPEMGAGMMDTRQLEADLHLALQRNELEVFYQPQIRLADGALVGFEALVRWRQPGRGLRPPADFLEVAATTGLIVPMGRFVLREACRQVRRWQSRQTAGSPLSVSVNLSAAEILQPDLVDAVRDALAASGLAPETLELEITETAVLEASEEARDVLRRLKGLGVGLAIDDFGVGYSYLSHLRDYPIDRVKIDRSFIAGLAGVGDDGTIVEAVVHLAHELGLEVVAEGVETRAQATLLAAMGCDVGQGYHYAPPLTARAAAQFGHAARAAVVPHRVRARGERSADTSEQAVTSR